MKEDKTVIRQQKRQLFNLIISSEIVTSLSQTVDDESGKCAERLAQKRSQKGTERYETQLAKRNKPNFDHIYMVKLRCDDDEPNNKRAMESHGKHGWLKYFSNEDRGKGTAKPASPGFVVRQ